VSSSDLLLKVNGSRQGQVKGEVDEAAHRNAIEVKSWTWGMSSEQHRGAHGSAGTRVQTNALTVRKVADTASVPLMHAMSGNELLRTVELIVRKVGITPLDYYIIKLTDAHIVKFDTDFSSGGGLSIDESWTFSFREISITYTQQGADGQRRNAMEFVYQNH
jgi:type VI secretion system secreted protein Hcp